MDTDSQSCWFRLAKLHIDIGGDVLRHLLHVKIQTAFLDDYASFCLQNIQSLGQINFCSLLLKKIRDQFKCLDKERQDILKPLLDKWKVQGHLALSKQLKQLEKWDSHIRGKLELGEKSVESTLLLWESQIKEEIQNINPLLEVLPDLNTSFTDRWNKYRKALTDTMLEKCDFMSNCSFDISKLEHPSIDDLKAFSDTFLKESSAMTQRCNEELDKLFHSWAKDFEDLIKNRQSSEQITHYNYILENFPCDTEIDDCQKNIEQICSSWYSHLESTVAAWQRLTNDVVNAPAKNEKLFHLWLQNLQDKRPWVTVWQQHTDEGVSNLTDIETLEQMWLQDLPKNISCQQQKLHIFFCSSTVQETLVTMKKNNILKNNPSFYLSSTIDFQDLLSLDTNCLLILLRKNCHVEPPVLGWHEETSDTDVSLGADLLRLEAHRNDLIKCLETISIPEETFISLWTRAEDVLNRLATHVGVGFQSKIRKYIESVKTCSIVPKPSDNFKLVILNWCKGAILADLADLSVSGKSMVSKCEPYIEMAHLVKRLCCPPQEFVYTDEKDLTWESSEKKEKTSKTNHARRKHQRWAADKVMEILDDKERAEKLPVATVTPLYHGVSLPSIKTQLIVKSHEISKQKEETWTKQSEHAKLDTDTKTPTSATKYYGTKPYGESVSDPPTEEHASEMETKFLDAIKNNDGFMIDEIFQNGYIPKKKLVRAAFEHYGSSKYIQSSLKKLSDRLQKEISQAVGVWCGYRTQDPHTPVFVVTLRDQTCIPNYGELQKSFDYEIVNRYQNVPNDEERTILKMSEENKIRTEAAACAHKCTAREIERLMAEENRIRAEDAARAHKCIATETERLMQEHINLSIIRACPVKACGYLQNELKVVKETCIVFSIPVKGIIPIGEKELPSYIDGIKTDVREGEFVFFADHNASKYHPNLRMGTCISTKDYSTGTLGGFVDLPDGKVGCITAAHVVLTKTQVQQYIHMTAEEKTTINMRLENGDELIEMYQPDPHQGSQPFGTVRNIALEPGNSSTPSVDAAIIQIIDESRRPGMGNFPDGNFDNTSFTKEYPMLYNSGEVCDEISRTQSGSIVVKFGKNTGITRGYLQWVGASVRPVTTWGNYVFQPMYGQMAVEAPKFADFGDSGALVFLCVGGNTRTLEAVGMVMGGDTSKCSTFITPIRPIFEQLGLTYTQFKSFHHVQFLQNEQILQPLSNRVDAQERVVSELNEKLVSLEENMKQGFSKVDALENNMTQGFRRVDSLEQNMHQGFQRVDLVQNEISNVNNSMTQGFRRVDYLEQNIHQGFQRVDFSFQNEIRNVNTNMAEGFKQIADLLNKKSSNT